MKDQLIKALACNEHVRIYLCSTTNLVEEARQRFDMWPTSAAALGRTLSVASMMGSMLKSDKELLTININGGGPIGSIVVDAYANGCVRGFCSDPHIMLQYNDSGKLAVGSAVGKNGYLSVTKDLHMKENWRGTVELVSGEIAEDFAYYFTVSEQTPSAVSLGVLVNDDNSIISAGGLIIQMMPDASEEDIVCVENLLKDLKPISTLMKDCNDLEALCNSLFNDVKILTNQDIAFECGCSKATMKRALMTIAKEDRLAMIEEDHGCEITCNFCNERYQFDEQELRDLESLIDTYGKEVENTKH